MEHIKNASSYLNRLIDARIGRHLAFIDTLQEEKKAQCYQNGPHGFPVKTRQETAIQIDHVRSVQFDGQVISCEYA